MKFVLSRLAEPSTWAGVAAIAYAIHSQAAALAAMPHISSAAIVTAVGGLLAAVLKENGSAT